MRNKRHIMTDATEVRKHHGNNKSNHIPKNGKPSKNKNILEAYNL
jgi:hypothetical protein